MKIAVTGGSGFIGSHLVELLLSKGHEVYNLSKRTYAINPLTLRHLDNNSKYHFLPVDIIYTDDLRRLFKEMEFDRIYHLAAETHVDRSFVNPFAFFINNAQGTWSVLEALRTSKITARLYYMSTDEVFGDVCDKYCSEEDALSPRNPYSAAKGCGELYCNAYFHSFGLPIVTGRSMNNYGPRQHPEKLIGKILSHCFLGKKYSLYKGSSIRGWTYVKDSVRAIELIMEKGVVGQSYNCAPNAYLTVPQVNTAILDILGCSELFRGFKGRRLKDDERYALSGEKVRFDLGFRHSYTFESGMKETINWWKENDWFWKK